MNDSPRVVFDCNTFLQAMASPGGPAGRCTQLAFDATIDLFISAAVLRELQDVAARPKVMARLRLTSARVDNFLHAIELTATFIEAVAEQFQYERDPDDAHYINLALAANARLVVSRDQDLLDLMDRTKPDSIAFQARFPGLRILTPVNFLHELAEGT